MARGGYRPGAGRPKGSKSKAATGATSPVDEEPIDAAVQEPLDYMLQVMRDPQADQLRRDRMAIAAAPFMHARKAEAGTKKADEQGAAKRAAARFQAATPPKLVVNNRG